MEEKPGSSALWGPLFGDGARTWAETWEGDNGWGGPAYDFVLTATAVGEGTRVLDCGCGAGRFLAMAASRGANVAGLDAAEQMVEIAASAYLALMSAPVTFSLCRGRTTCSM